MLSKQIKQLANQLVKTGKEKKFVWKRVFPSGRTDGWGFSAGPDEEIEIQLTKEQANLGYKDDCRSGTGGALRKQPDIKKQLAKLKPELVIKALLKYGAWSRDELTNHDKNLNNILYLACEEIKDKNVFGF